MATERELTIVVRAREQAAEVLARVVKATQGVNVSVEATNRALRTMGQETHQVSQGFTTAQARLVSFDAAVNLLEKGIAFFHQVAAVAFDNFVQDAQKFTSASRQFNIPVEAISALNFVAEATGASFDGLTFGLRRFAVSEQKALDGNAETVAAFKALGFQAGDVKRLVGQDLVTSFFEVGTALGKIQNQAERTTIAFRLFGRGGRDAVTIGLEPAVKELIRRFEDLGGVMSTTTNDKFRAFHHEALETTVGVRALFRDLLVGSGVLDAINALLERGVRALIAFRKQPGELGAAMLAVGRAFADVLTAVSDFLAALFGGGGATNGLRLVAVAAEATAVAIEKLAGFLRRHTEVARGVSIAITALSAALITGAAAWALYQVKVISATLLTTLTAPFTSLLGILARVPVALRAVSTAFAGAQAAQAVGTGFAALGTSIAAATQSAAGLQTVTKGISEAALAQQALRVAAINATPAIAGLSAAMQVNAADAVLAGGGGAAIKAAFATEAAAAGAVGESLAGLGVSMAAAETATVATSAVTVESVGIWGALTAALALVGKGILAVVAFIGGWPVVIGAALAAFAAYIIGWKNLWAAVMAVVHLLVAVWDVLYYQAGRFFGALPEWFSSLRAWLLSSVPGLQRFVDLFSTVTEKVERLAQRIKSAVPTQVAVPPGIAAPAPFYQPQPPVPLAPTAPSPLFTPGTAAGLDAMRERLKGLLSGQLDAKDAAEVLKAALLDLGQAGKTSGDGLGEGGKKAQEFAAKLKELRTTAADTQAELQQQKAFLVQLQNVPAGTTVEGIKQIVEQQKLALDVSKNRIEADKAINEAEAKFKDQPGLKEAVAAIRAIEARKDALAALTPELEKARTADEHFIKTMGQAATATTSATGGELELEHLTNQITDRMYELAKAEEAARAANITDPAKIAQLKQLSGALYDAKQNAAGMTSVFGFLANTGKDFFDSIIVGGRGFKDFMKTVPASIEKGFVEGFFKGLQAKTNFDKLFEVNIFTLVKNMGEFLTGSRGIGDIFEGAFGGATAATKTATAQVAKTVAGLAPAINQSVQPVSHALTQSFADWDKGAQTASRNVASYAHDGASATITAAQSMSNAEIAAAAKTVDAASATAGANVQAAQTSQSAWGGFFQFLLQTIETAVSSILSLFTTLASTLFKILGGLGDLVGGIFSGIGSLFSGGGSGSTGSTFGGIVDFVQNIFGTGGIIAKGFGFVTSLFGGGGGGGSFFGIIKDAASAVFGADGVIGKYFTSIKSYFTGGKLGSVFSTLGSLAAVIGGGFAAFQGVMTLFSHRASALQRVLGGGEAILGLATAFRGLQTLLPQFAHFVQGIVSASLVAQGISAPLPGALGAGGTIGITQFIGALFSKTGFGALSNSLSGLTTTLGNLVSPLQTIVSNIEQAVVGAVVRAIVNVIPSLAASLGGGSGPVVAGLVVNSAASEIGKAILGKLGTIATVITAIYSGVTTGLDAARTLSKVEHGAPEAKTFGAIAGFITFAAILIAGLAAGPVGAIIAAIITKIVTTQLEQTIIGAISKAQQPSRQGATQKQLDEAVGGSLVAGIATGGIGSLFGLDFLVPNIETLFDKIFAEVISKAVSNKNFQLAINRNLKDFLGEGVPKGARYQQDLGLFEPARPGKGQPAGALRSDTYGTASLVAGLIGAGSENAERIRRFFTILANNFAQTGKPVAELQGAIYRIVRSVTGSLTVGLTEVSALFEHASDGAAKTAKALADQEHFANRTRKEVDLVSRSYQVVVDRATKAGATPVSIAAIAAANERATGGVKLKPFGQELNVQILQSVVAGDLDLTKKLAGQLGSTFLFAVAQLKDAVPAGVSAAAVALKVAQEGGSHEVKEFVKQLHIASLEAAAGGAAYTKEQARKQGDALGFLAAKLQKDVPEGVNAFAAALKIARSDVPHQARALFTELQKEALAAAAAGATYTIEQASALGDILGATAAALKDKLPPGINAFALALAVGSDNIGKSLARLLEAVKVERDLFAKGLPLLTPDELARLKVPTATGGAGRRQQKDLLTEIEARQTIQLFLNQTAAAAAGTGPREQFAEIEQKRAAATQALPDDITVLRKNEALLARYEAQSRAAIAAGDQKAAQEAQKNADKVRKAVGDERKAVTDLAQQAIDAAKAWGEAVRSLVNSIRDLDKAARDFNLAMNEQIATLRKSTDTASVYNTEITRQRSIIDDTTQSAATRVQAVQDLAGLYQQQATAEINDINRVADARKEALNKELDAIQPLANLADSIHKQLLDLKVAAAGGSPGAGYQKIAFLQDEIAKKRRLFETSTGDMQAKAATDLQDLLQQLLQVGGDFFGTTSGQYQALQKESLGILQEMDDRAQAAAKKAADIQDDIKAIDQETKDAIDAVNIKLAAQLETLRDTAVPLFAAMRQTLVDQLGEQFPGLTPDQLETLIDNPQALGNAIQQGISDRLDKIYDVLSKQTGLDTAGKVTNEGGKHAGLSVDDAGVAHAAVSAASAVRSDLRSQSRGAVGKQDTLTIASVLQAAIDAVNTIPAGGRDSQRVVFYRAAVADDIARTSGTFPAEVDFRGVARVAQFVSDDLAATFDNTGLDAFKDDAAVLKAFFASVKALAGTTRLERGGPAVAAPYLVGERGPELFVPRAASVGQASEVVAAALATPPLAGGPLPHWIGAEGPALFAPPVAGYVLDHDRSVQLTERTEGGPVHHHPRWWGADRNLQGLLSIARSGLRQAGYPPDVRASIITALLHDNLNWTTTDYAITGSRPRPWRQARDFAEFGELFFEIEDAAASGRRQSIRGFGAGLLRHGLPARAAGGEVMAARGYGEAQAAGHMALSVPALHAGGVTLHGMMALLGERGPEAILPLTDPQALKPISLALRAALSGGQPPATTSLKPQAESATDLGGGLQRFAAPAGGKVEIKATIVLQPAKGESEANVRLYMRTAKNEFEAQLVESAEHGALRKYLGKRQVR